MSSGSGLQARNVDAVAVSGLRILYRCDLNVPMQDGIITDTTRIDRAAKGIASLAERGAKVVVIAHFGRPKGKPNQSMSLQPVADALAEAVGRPVAFASDCIGSGAEQAVAGLVDGQIVLLENLRFHAGEEANDPRFASQLAGLADLYVGDAFSAAHRAHASTEAVVRLLPSYAGPLMTAELAALSAALEQPARPLAALVGGAKVSTKLAVLHNLVSRVEAIIIGGGMANTFLLAAGHTIGASLAEAEMVNEARAIMAAAETAGCRLVLPLDLVLARQFVAGAENRCVMLGEPVADDEMILDAGPVSITAAAAVIDNSATLVWNGPMGAFEIPPFNAATNALARHAAAATKAGKLVSIAGGGDTVAALNQAGVGASFSYVSTAGGAFLEWLEGRDLPGVSALVEAAG